MGKIFVLMGKSSTGKDTIYWELRKQALGVKQIVPYTTRPIRQGEVEGREYHFCDEAYVEQLQAQGRIVELRAYDTVLGVWKYFTVDDGQIQLDKNSYLLIGTLETYLKIREYYGKENVLPIYIEVEDGERLARALQREREESEPKYTELCRRFLADSEDFSEEHLEAAGIEIRFENLQLETTVNAVVHYIEENL